MKYSKAIYISRYFDLKKEDGMKRRVLVSLEGLSSICDEIYCIFLSDQKINIGDLKELEKFKVREVKIINIPKLTKIKAVALSKTVGYYNTIYSSKKVIKKVNEFLYSKNKHFDIIFSNFFYFVDLVEKINCKNPVTKVVDLVDAVSLHIAEARDIPIHRKFFYKLVEKEVFRLEKKSILSNNVCLITTDYEKEYLSKEFSLDSSTLDKIKIVGNFVDQELIDFGERSAEKYEDATSDFTMAFIGNLSYYPNEQAVLRLVKLFNIFLTKSKSYKRNPKLLIIGKNPTKKIKNVSSKVSNIELLGYVENLQDISNRVHLFVLPMRIASGIQNKLLTGLALGIPTIISRRARFCKELVDGKNVIFADTDEEYLAKLEHYYDHPEELKQISYEANLFAKKYLAKEYVIKNFIESLL